MRSNGRATLTVSAAESGSLSLAHKISTRCAAAQMAPAPRRVEARLPSPVVSMSPSRITRTYLSFVSAGSFRLQHRASESQKAFSRARDSPRAGSKSAEASVVAAAKEEYPPGRPLFLANAAKLPAQAAGASKRDGTPIPRLRHSHSIARARSLRARVTFVA